MSIQSRGIAIGLEAVIKAICKQAKDTIWVSNHCTAVEELQHCQIRIDGWHTDITEWPKTKRVKEVKLKLN